MLGARPLGAEAFRILRDAIYSHCGIWFDDATQFLLERRAAPRLDALGVGDFDEYCGILRGSLPAARRAEMDELVELCTTKETYFFREQYQLEAYRDEILPAIFRANQKKKRITVWSAGCSSGEEAYTVAILLLESGLFTDWDVRIFGSDMSRRMLQIARRARYGKNSFRSGDPRLLRRYFKELDGQYEVKDEVKNLVRFGHINLIDGAQSHLVGDVDVLFCRNVLIYFDLKSRKQVLDGLYQKLLPGGYLCLGHSETLLNVTTAFELVHLKSDLVYRRPLDSEIKR